MKRIIFFGVLLLSTGCSAMDGVLDLEVESHEGTRAAGGYEGDLYQEISPRRTEVPEQSAGQFENAVQWANHLLQDNSWSSLNVRACLAQLKKDHDMLTQQDPTEEITKALGQIEGSEGSLLQKWVQTITEGRNCQPNDVVACLTYLAQHHEKLNVPSQGQGEFEGVSESASRHSRALEKMLDAVRSKWCEVFFERKKHFGEWARDLICGVDWSVDTVEECLEGLNKVYDHLTDAKNFRQLIIAMKMYCEDTDKLVTEITNQRRLLRIDWAERLLNGVQGDPDHIVIGKCLHQVELVISEALSLIQRAFSLHGNRIRSKDHVRVSLPAIEDLLEKLIREDAVLDARSKDIIDEVKPQSPQSEDTESSVFDTVEVEEEVDDHSEFLGRKDELFNQVVAAIGVASSMDDTFADQLQDEALKAKVKAENEEMRKLLVDFVKARMVRVPVQALKAHDGSTEALEEEYNALVLQQQLSAILEHGESGKVKEFEKKKLANRKALIKRLNDEAQAFKLKHEQLSEAHKKNKVLRARLRFLAKGCLEAREDGGEDILAQYLRKFRMLPTDDDKKLFEEWQGNQKSGNCVIC